MTTTEFGALLKKRYPQTSSFISGMALFFIDAIASFCVLDLDFSL